jgi:ankyrin repeat protein
VAAREDRLADLKRLITQGGDVNSQSDAGDTALIYASRNCSTKVVEYLLSLKNADGSPRTNVNVRDKLGRTALMYAAYDSCAPVVRDLLEVPDVELGIRDRDGRTLREYALNGAELEMGGPASDTYSLIRAAEQRARARRGRIARRQ